MSAKHNLFDRPPGLKKRRKPAIDAPIQDAIVRLVGELDITLSVDQGAFGDFEPIGELFELRPGAMMDDSYEQTLAGPAKRSRHAK